MWIEILISFQNIKTDWKNHFSIKSYNKKRKAWYFEKIRLKNKNSDDVIRKLMTWTEIVFCHFVLFELNLLCAKFHVCSDFQSKVIIAAGSFATPTQKRGSKSPLGIGLTLRWYSGVYHTPITQCYWFISHLRTNLRHFIG